MPARRSSLKPVCLPLPPLFARRPDLPQCCSVSWNSRQRQLFLSSSWDDSIKLWSLGAPASLRTFLGHTYCVYQVSAIVTAVPVVLSFPVFLCDRQY